MSFSSIAAILAQAQQQPPNLGDLLRTMGPMVIILVAFMLIMNFSQQKKVKQHENLLNSLKSGDKIVTSSGIVAVVIAVKDKSVSIRSADTKLEVLKSSVAEVTERSQASES